MSYILEALKKSERERDIESIPTISAYDTTPTEQSKRALYLLAGLVACLTLALVSVIYWKASHPAKTQPSAHEQVSSYAQPSHVSSATKQAREVSSATRSPLTPPPLTTPLVPEFPIAAPIKTTPRSNVQETTSPAVESLFDMSDQFQRQIPALNYASHWYAKEPRSRNVIINNRSLKEGDWVNSSIQILEISQHQLTLTMQQQAFSLPALESWAP